MLHTSGIATEEKVAIFSSYNGKSYSCSPKAIYEYMISCPDFKDFKYVWIFKDIEKHSDIENNINTKIVKYNSAECDKALKKAKYWFFNFRALEHWVPTKEQIYVQCWHGTPLKRLGYDIMSSKNAMNSRTEIQRKYKTDAQHFTYMVSPSAFTTEKLKNAFDLKNNNSKVKIIEKGYPRNDFLINHDINDVYYVKKKLNLPENKKIILYAPTWRDDQHDSKLGYIYKLNVNFDILREKLGDEYVILFRSHYFIANNFDFNKYEGFIYDVSEIDEINELYIISDMLITDYSSVFFDYSVLKKPIIFFMYDLEAYENEIRGFYIDLKELPGPITLDEHELCEKILLQDYKSHFNSKYAEFNQKYTYLEDGQASKRVVDEIIRGK